MDLDVQISLLAKDVLVLDGKEANLVKSVGSVGDQLTEENLIET
jgi:hypothetical protein